MSKVAQKILHYRDFVEMSKVAQKILHHRDFVVSCETFAVEVPFMASKCLFDNAFKRC